MMHTLNLYQLPQTAKKIKQVNQDEIQKKKTLIVDIYKLNGTRAQVHVVLELEGVDARDLLVSGAYRYPRKPKRLCRSSSLGRRLYSSCDRGVTQRSVWKTLSPTCTMSQKTKCGSKTELLPLSFIYNVFLTTEQWGCCWCY